MNEVLMRTSLALVALSVTAGCNYSLQKGVSMGAPNSSSSPNPGTAVPSDPDLNFDNVFNTSIKTSCFGCHAAPRNASGINLETYESVFANRQAVQQAVASRAMPDSMGRTMSDSARDLLLRWLAAGAPRTAPAALFEIDTETGLMREIQSKENRETKIGGANETEL